LPARERATERSKKVVLYDVAADLELHGEEQ
jgi:hypothetical protein